MSKRTAIIIIILAIILGTGALYFLLGGRAPLENIPLLNGLPFGTPPDDSLPTTIGDGISTPTTGGVDGEGRPLPNFLKLSDAPVAGFISILKNGLTHVRFVDRATGHVFDINPTTLEKTRITNTTMPRIHEAIFREDGDGFVSRRISDNESVSNTSISLIAPQGTSTDSFFDIQSVSLRGDLGEIVLLPNNNLLYSALDTETVVTSTFTGSGARTLFSLTFSDWRFYPISNTGVFIATKASRLAPGYAYRLNIQNGQLTKVLGPLNGLSILPNPTGDRIAFSHATAGNIFSVRNLANSTTLEILPTTSAEKCVWSKQETSLLICGAPEDGLGSNFPDSWYGGETNFSDRIWRFNTVTDTAELLLEPEENFNQSIDVLAPALSPDEDFLFFINKDDLSLWALKLDIN